MKILCTISLFILLLFPIAGAQQAEVVMIKSTSMDKMIPNTIITPTAYFESDEQYPVIYLLHGAGGNHQQWLMVKPELAAYADRFKVIIVLPDGGSTSWYFDSPIDASMKYETYISKELIQFVDTNYRTIPTKEGRAISGLSMGGHGALYLAMKHTNIWGVAGSTSGGVDIRPFPHSWDIALRLGHFQKHRKNWEENTVINLVDDLKDNELRLIFDCGVDDFFFEVNEKLHEKLQDLGISHVYISRPGNHDHGYWSISIPYHMLFFSSYFESLVLQD